MKLIDGSHYKVRLTDRERTQVRLWIASGATTPAPTPRWAAACTRWICLTKYSAAAVPSVTRRPKPSYRHVKKDAFYYQFGRRAPPQPLLTSVQDIILIRHLAYFQPGESRLYQAYGNLSRPAQSLFLQRRSPSRRAVWGSAVPPCSPSRRMRTTGAPGGDHQGRRATGRKQTLQPAGHFPNRFYIEEMQNFSILPRPLPPDYKIDVYATDQAYWRSCQRP